MLREIYVISRGLNLYYLSLISPNNQYVESNLTSGLLTAIQSFTIEARKSEVEFFSSKDEFFLFTPVRNTQKMLICVFERESNRDLANILLGQIKSVIETSHLVEKEYENLIDDQKNAEVTKRIEKILDNKFDSGYPVKIASDIFTNNPSFSLIRVLDLDKGETYFEDARPKALLKPNQLTELNLLNASLNKLCERLNIEAFEYIIIECKGAKLGILKNNQIIAMSFSSGLIDIQEFNETTFRLFDKGSFAEFTSSCHSINKEVFTIDMNKNGEIITSTGSIPQMIEIFFSTVLNALDRYVSTFIRRQFIDVTIYLGSNEYYNLYITRDDTKHSIKFYAN